ncbi:MAG: PAS domain S-box protein [Nitriliruptorales bacterium]
MTQHGPGGGFSADLLIELVYHAPDAVLVIDPEGAIAFANPRTADLFGYGPEDLIGLPIESLIPERFRAAHLEHRRGYAEAPRARPMGTGLKLFGLRSDGSEFPVEIGLSPLGAAGGRLTTAIVRDVTEAVQAREVEARLREVRRRQAQALELNDDIIQGLSTALLALMNDDVDMASTTIEATLDAARSIVSDLLSGLGDDGVIRPGDLVRAEASPSVGPSE